jgi:hypothetical protein
MWGQSTQKAQYAALDPPLFETFLQRRRFGRSNSFLTKIAGVTVSVAVLRYKHKERITSLSSEDYDELDALLSSDLL